ncbi:hypothetical protein [Angustibacter luteus]|uniref:Glycosyltransferase RgtA/B/C/D-like domain-containing protein n=1 Tax=Angustibacter luteus TaxID=658456 RepID=A0ABW1JGX6_9ACTN
MPERGRLAAALSRTGCGLATWVLAVTVLAVPLVAVGAWVPPVAAVVLLVGALPAVLLARRVPVADVGAPAAALVLAVAVGAGVWAGATHAEHTVLRRDAGTYALFGQHLATTHQGRVDVSVDDLGGAKVLALPGVGVGSPGFYEQGSGTGTHVVPQFLVATPLWLSVGWWLGGWTGLLLVPAVALGAAVLAFGALAVRLVGGWWGLLATTALAVCQPVLHAGRATYSEPFALLVACAGAGLLVAACRALSPRLALLAGLLIGGTALVRVDAVRETAMLLPAAALLATRGRLERSVAGRFVLGLLVATLAAAASAALLSRPYLASISASLVPLAALAVLFAVGSAAVVLLAGRGVRLPDGVRSRLPWLLPAAVALVAVLLASRPLWQTVRQSAADSGSRVVAALQVAQGLPVDGGRTYAEHSLQWVAWWVGLPALLLALVGAVGAARRVARAWADDDELPAWTVLLVAALGSTVLTLYRPGITPDHPWADRRLVPVVLPTVLLLAVAGARGLAALAAARWTAAAVRPVLVAAAALAIVVPGLLATWPLAGQRTERGEPAAVARACDAFGPDDTAVLVDSRAANEWTQVLRGVCDVPTVVVASSSAKPADLATVVAVSQAVLGAGRRPVVVSAGSPDALRRLGAAPSQVVRVGTVEDQRLLTRRPDGDAPLSVDLWLAPAT